MNSLMRGEKGVYCNIISRHVRTLSQYIAFQYPVMGWYFSTQKPGDAVGFVHDKSTCMFRYMEQVREGKKICFSAQEYGCSGAGFYLGFKSLGNKAGYFLAEKEKFKKSVEYGNAFYDAVKPIKTTAKYLILGKLQSISENVNIEVVNLWVDSLGLTGLVTLANYDRETNDNVIIPFASGCQSMWTIPYMEKDNKKPRAVVGCMDPAMRRYIKSDILLFSVSAKRLAEMAENVEGSFLQRSGWTAFLP